MFKSLLFLVLVTFSPTAFAFTWVDQEIARNMVLQPGTGTTLPIDREIHQVQRLVIEAEGIAQEAMFEVLVNGDVKGTIHVPGRDPRYIVTVAEATRSIELRHTSGAAVRIHRIVATVSRESLPDGRDPIDLPNLNFITDKSLQLLSLYRRMWDQVSPQDREDYLLPLRISAGRLYAMASGHGDISSKTRRALQATIWQIDISQDFWNRCFRNDQLFNITVEILAIKERLAGAAD